MTLAVGDKAPNFSALDQHGKKVKLADFKGQKLIVYFYPKADTPGCTTQSCELRDAHHHPAFARVQEAVQDAAAHPHQAVQGTATREPKSPRRPHLDAQLVRRARGGRSAYGLAHSCGLPIRWTSTRTRFTYPSVWRRSIQANIRIM